MMAHDKNLSSEIQIAQNYFPISSFDGTFQRRIEFHLARKPFNPFSHCSGDFHVATLNPNVNNQPPFRGDASCLLERKQEVGREVLDHALDLDINSEIRVRKIGAGLANLGNTCFLNSVLQCLTYTEPFAAYLQSGKHKSSCHTTGFCAMCAIQSHVRSALESTGKILSPYNLVKNLRCISRSFRNSRQEDAHEYMVNLLESMHKCCLPYGVSSESSAAYDKSLVHNIFGGCLRSQVKCMQCCHCSDTFDPFLDLSLEIIRADSLRKALAHFTAEEQLDGGDKQYHCQRCKEKVQALKQLTVHKAPIILTIHLKRFGSHNLGQKIDKKVDFTPFLDLSPFVSDDHGGDLRYQLYGVLVHTGWSTHSGHYSCFVRTSSGLWYSLDDNQVAQVSEKTVFQQKAYMLFYARERRTITGQRSHPVFRNGDEPHTVLNKAFSLKNAEQNGHMEKKVDAYTLSNGIIHSQSLSGVEVSADNKLARDKALSQINLDMAGATSLNGCPDLTHMMNDPGFQSFQKFSKDCQEFRKTVRKEFKHLSNIKNMIHEEVGIKEAKSVTSGKFSTSKGAHLGSKWFVFKSLTFSKRQKQRKRKRKGSVVKESLQRELMERSTPCDLGECSSGKSWVDEVKYNVVSSGKKEHPKQAGNGSSIDVEKRCIRESDSYSPDCLFTSNDGCQGRGFIPRISMHGGSEETDTQEKSGSVQFGLMSMLMRGLQEATVGQWDGVEMQLTDRSEPPRSSIGYIPDEWDEEYDRGKRKKVRKTKRLYDGKNPFQEISTKKTQFEKMRLEGQVSSGNMPFRIRL